MHSCIFHSVFASVGWVALLHTLPTALTNDGDLLKKVLTDWERRQSNTHTLRYYAIGKAMMPKGALSRLGGDSGQSHLKSLVRQGVTRWQNG